MASSKLFAGGPTSISVADVAGDSPEVIDATRETGRERRGLGRLAARAARLAVFGLARASASACSLWSAVRDRRSSLKAANSRSHSSAAWAFRASRRAA